MTTREVRGQVAQQYGTTTARLDARVALHEAYSVSATPWQTWVFDRLRLVGGERLLEVGAGTGSLWERNLSRLPAESSLVLTDLSSAMCSRLARLPIERLLVCRADAGWVPLRDAGVDVVVADHMLYHVPDPDSALAEMARVLRPGGRAYAATNGRNHMQELEALAEMVGAAYQSTRFHLAFPLEHAAARMRPHFGDVEVIVFEDWLEVTQAQPVVQYLESVMPLSDTQRRTVLDAVEREIRESGCFTISKSVGLLEAACPAHR